MEDVRTNPNDTSDAAKVPTTGSVATTTTNRAETVSSINSLIRYVIREPKSQNIIVLSDDEDGQTSNITANSPKRRPEVTKTIGTQLCPITLSDSDDGDDDDVILVESSSQWSQRVNDHKLKLEQNWIEQSKLLAADNSFMEICQSFDSVQKFDDAVNFEDMVDRVDVDNNPSQDPELIANSKNPPTVVHTRIPPNTTNIELLRALDIYIQSLDLPTEYDSSSVSGHPKRLTRSRSGRVRTQQGGSSSSSIPNTSSPLSTSSGGHVTYHNRNTPTATILPHITSNIMRYTTSITNSTRSMEQPLQEQDTPLQNRPYVPARAFYNSTWEDWAQLEPGDILHYPFTTLEIETLEKYCQRYSPKLKRSGLRKWQFVAEHLPGRTESACQHFYKDYQDNLHHQFQQAIMVKRKRVPLRPKTTHALLRERSLTGNMRVALTRKYLWTNMAKEKKIDGGSGDVISVAIFTNPTTGLKIAAGSVCDENSEYNMPGNLRLWDVNTASSKALNGHQTTNNSGEAIWRTVTDVKASKDKTLLFSASHDGSANIWKASSGRLRSTLSFHSKPINQIAVNYSTNENVIATCSEDGTATVWTIDRKGKSGSGVICELENTNALDPRVDCVEFGHHETNNTLFLGVSTGSIDHPGYVEGYDIVTGKPNMRFQDMHGSVSTLAISSEGRIVASGNYSRYDDLSGDKHLHLHDTRQQRSPLKFLTNHADVNLVSISPCDRFVASGNADKVDGQVVVFDIRQPNKKLYTLKHDQSVLDQSLIASDASVGIGGLHWMSDSRILVTGGGDLMVKLWDVCTGNLLKSYETSNCVTSLAVDEDNNMIAAGVSGADGIVHVWTP